MVSTTLDVPTPDGVADAYAAWPEESGRFPGVLCYMDVFGLRPVLHEMVNRLAAQGYFVLAPNVFYRAGRTPDPAQLPDLTDPSQREATLAQGLQKVQEHTPERVVRDAGAFLDFLGSRPEVAEERPFGTTGYCLGGVLAVRTAAARPEQVGAAASFHAGGLVTDGPDSPHLLAERISAELHFGHAAKDDHMTPEDVATLERALDAADVRYTSEVYPNALHGFTMADVPSFNADALQRHWERLLPLFARNLQES